MTTTATTATEPTQQHETLTGTYDIDPAHSRIGFAAKHAMITTVRGSFTSFRGEAYLDEEHPENSRAVVEIDVASIDTGNAERDAHLRSNDFFDIANHPTITFVSTAVKREDDVYTLIGELAINGKTRPVSVQWELTGTSTDPWGNFRAGFEGTATVNRRDWDLNWNLALDKGGLLVGEKVRLEFDVAAVKREQ